MPSRREAILKAFLTREALERRIGVTARELSSILGYGDNLKNHSYESAKRWIDVASLVLPVSEIGKRRYRDAITGPEATVYGIRKEM